MREAPNLPFVPDFVFFVRFAVNLFAFGGGRAIERPFVRPPIAQEAVTGVARYLVGNSAFRAAILGAS
jgi:hypothetical protein